MQGAILECAQCLLPVTGQRSNSLYGIQVDCNRLARANPINGSRSAPNWLESIRLNHLLQLDWLWLNIYRCIDDIHLRSIEISCVATLPLFIALFSGTADDVTASVFHRRFQVNASRSIDWIQSGLFSPVDRGLLELFFFYIKMMCCERLQVETGRWSIELLRRPRHFHHFAYSISDKLFKLRSFD